MDDLHLDMCSHLHGSVPVSGLGCSDFLVRILPRHIVQTISLGRVSGLAKNGGDFLSCGRFRAIESSDRVGRTAEGHESSAISQRYTHVGKEALSRATGSLPEI
jgi:hypothetical protein